MAKTNFLYYYILASSRAATNFCGAGCQPAADWQSACREHAGMHRGRLRLAAMWGRLPTCGGLGAPSGPRLPRTRRDAPGRLRLVAMWGRLPTCGGLGAPSGPRLPRTRRDAPGRLRLAAMWGRLPTCGGLGAPSGPRLPRRRRDAPGRLRLAGTCGFCGPRVSPGPRKRRLKAGGSQDWLPHNLCGIPHARQSGLAGQQ